MFNFDEFSEHDSYDDKISYAKENLNFISSDRDRNVFELDSERVIKIANNEDGMICNNVEKHFSDSGWKRLAKVLDYDDDFMWVVSEKADAIDDITFQKMCGISLDQLYKHLYQFRNQKSMSKYKASDPSTPYDLEIVKILEEARKTAISYEINSKSEELCFNTSDIPYFENLGVMKRDGEEMLVIVNYGHFENRFRKYPLRTE